MLVEYFVFESVYMILNFFSLKQNFMKIEDVKQVFDWLGVFQEQDKDKIFFLVVFGEWLQQQGEVVLQLVVLLFNIDGLIFMFFGFMANYVAYYVWCIFCYFDLYFMIDWVFLAILEQEEFLIKLVLIQKNILEKFMGIEVFKCLKK